MNQDSDLPIDPASTAGAALFALAVVGHVHPEEISASDADWKTAQATLDACGYLLDVDSEGRYFVANVDADGYPLGLPQKARAVVERNPAWRRAVLRAQIWPVIQDHARLGRDFIARALSDSDSACIAS